MAKPMSPSSRGVIPGLLFAVVAAVAVLAVNDSWLLPGADETGVAYLTATPMIVAGVPPTLPWADWDAPEARTGLGPHSTGMPLVMSALMRLRPRTHVAAVWTLAAAAGALLFGLGWVAGGVAGMRGAAVVGFMTLASGPIVVQATALRPELLAMAAVAILLGVMTYQPRWRFAHGAVAGLAWLAHPAGLGAVVAAAAWPSLARRRVEWKPARHALVAPAVMVASAPLFDGLWFPRTSVAEGKGALVGLEETVRWFGAGLPGWIGLGLGAASALAVAAWVLRDAVRTPPVSPDVHWSDPAAPDLLAETFRPVAGLLAVCLGLAGLAGLGPDGSLAAPWSLALVPLVALTGTTIVRMVTGSSDKRRWWIAAAAGLWLAAGAFTTNARLAPVLADGQGLTARGWLESPVVRWVDNRSDGLGPLRATQPELWVIQSNRGSRRLPRSLAEMDAFAAYFADRPGPIVVTGSARGGPAVEDYLAALDVVVVVEVEEGTVLVPTSSAGITPD